MRPITEMMDEISTMLHKHGQMTPKFGDTLESAFLLISVGILREVKYLQERVKILEEKSND